eukprot:1160996-Pelagomonas_calceolata.AAC.1
MRGGKLTLNMSLRCKHIAQAVQEYDAVWKTNNRKTAHMREGKIVPTTSLPCKHARRRTSIQLQACPASMHGIELQSNYKPALQACTA